MNYMNISVHLQPVKNPVQYVHISEKEFFKYKFYKNKKVKNRYGGNR